MRTRYKNEEPHNTFACFASELTNNTSIVIVTCSVGWQWYNHVGHKMINRLTNTFQVNRHLQCMINCTLSPICDSYNYRPSDKTCELNTHDTPLIANSADIVADSAWGWWSTDFVAVL